MDKILVFYKEYVPTIDAMKNQLKGKDVVISNLLPDDYLDYDLVIGVGNIDVSKYENINMLVCHKSLLPAFNTDDPIREAILNGVKVSGITIFYTKNTKIVAQYPVFIQNDWHYDDLKLELDYLEQVLFPLVCEKIAKNEIVDMKTLMNKSGSCNNCCSGASCSSCGACHSNQGV